MRYGAKNKEYKREPERRHFRGDSAINSVKYLSKQGTQKLFQGIADFEHIEDFRQYVEDNWVGFGPWISFKMADMMERVLGQEISFGMDSLRLFPSPQEGAEIVMKRKKSLKSLSDVVLWLHEEFSDMELTAPPDNRRALGLQEIETILCKFKSHSKGRYQVGDDIASLKHALGTRCKSKTAQELLQIGKGLLW